MIHLDFRFKGGRRLPVLLQTEAAECGIACLAMVASYWGHHVDLQAVRRRFSVSLKGAALKSLVQTALGLGLQARPVKLDLPALRHLRMPCVLHWDMTHFVVLKAVTRTHVVIHDPAVGERRMAMDDAARHFTGVALELSPGPDFRKTSRTPPVGLRVLMGKVFGLRRGLGQLLLLGLALQACALVSPFYLQWIVDEALVAGDRDLVTVLGIGFLLLAVLQATISAVRSWVATVLASDLNLQWLGRAFAHLMQLPLPYFEKRHLGDVVSRFDSIETIQKALTTQVVEGIIDGLLVSLTGIAMLLYSAKLTVISLATVGLYVLLRWSIFQALREANSEQIIHAARQQTHFLESARGVQTLRLFGRADERRIGWMNTLADQFNAELRVARLTISWQTAGTLLFSVERVVMVWLAALAVIDGRFSVGMLFAFMSYQDQFSERLSALVDKLYDLRMLRLHGERVADIVMTEPEQPAPETEVDPGRVPADIELRNVSFRYADGEPYVLRHLDLQVPAGQCIAITGASGCGKTTLVKLLLGLLVPTEGDILVGGMRIQRLGLANLRRLVGAVMQEDLLFSGSLGDNIAFFDPATDSAQVQACARLAAIHDEIMAMPMAYHTLVGDIGTGLSGGQRQRILLARALYKNPRILVLDEATSHLDIANEQSVNASIAANDLTRLLVAHRPETIAMADRVVVLHEGRVRQDVACSRRHGEGLADVAA